MSKELKALIRIEDLLNRLYETDVINDDHTHETNIIGKALKRLEELEKAFDALSKDDEKAKKQLSKEIEKNRALEIMIEKDITPSWFIRNLKQGMTYEDYHSSNSGQYDMTREQFDTLAEVLL